MVWLEDAMPKIAIIGAGSVVFTRVLVGDLLSFPALEGSHLSLMDVDEQRLALIGRLAEKLVRDSGVAATGGHHVGQAASLRRRRLRHHHHPSGRP